MYTFAAMASPSPKAKDVDEYIAQASDATRPILVALRRCFQKASPLLEEAIKWGVPCYVYKGPVGGFAAYRNHVTWGLWKATLLDDPHELIGDGILKGGKISSLAEVPPTAAFIRLIQQAVALNEAGVKAVTPDPELPADFASALNKQAKAAKLFAALTPARKWQFVNWITKAKRPATRTKRLETAIDMIRDGKTMK